MNRELVVQGIATLFGGAQVGNTWPNLNPVLTAAGFVYFNRRLKVWNQVDAADKPALFLVGYEEEHSRANIVGPDKRTMSLMLVIMDDVKDQGLIPSQRLNPLLDAIDAVLQAATDVMTGRLTLGGLVSHVWVEGQARLSVGDTDNQTVAVYPIKVLCP